MKALRIFYAAHPSPNVVAFPESQLWRLNLFQPLVDLGHEVIPFEYDLTPHFQNLDPSDPEQRAFIAQNRCKLEFELLRQIEQHHRERPIDLFFSYFYSACVRPETIRAIRDRGILAVNWYCNGSYQFHLVEEIAPAYDYCLVPEEFRLADYRRIGAKPIYVQEAANPNVYRPQAVPRTYDIVFVGQRYGERPAYIRRLQEAGLDVRVWGVGWSGPQQRLARRKAWRRRAANVRSASAWRRLAVRTWRRGGGVDPEDQDESISPEICGPPLADEDMIAMYSRAKISLGFSSCGETHRTDRRILQVRLRDFEAPMSGAFYMVEYMQELEQFYEIGKEIVCYHDPDDLVEKARYYLEHEDQREAIRQAGHARAVRDHTWHRRFETAFKAMGLD